MMSNKEIAENLKMIGVILELQGENPFKTRSYSNAARTIERLEENIADIHREGRLLEVKGIGKNIAKKIEEMLTEGKSIYLENLKQTIPSGLLDLFNIPGMGAKKIKTVYEKLEVSSIGELEYACLENRLIDLPGFGEKTQAKILEGIQFLKQFQQYHLLPTALSLADEIMAYLKSNPQIEKIELAGSLRRRKEIVKDIDILIQVEEGNRKEVGDFIIDYPGIITVTGKGDTKISFRVQRGIQVDIRMIRQEEFPTALQHFTGSKEHNTRLRQIAKSLSLKLNEYGLFERDKKIPVENEAEIYERLGMQFIIPEYREDEGEIELAQQQKLHEPVKREDILGLIHMHSNWSDGSNTVQELAEYIHSAGYQYMGISDHSKSSFYANGLSEERIFKQFAEIDHLNNLFKNSFRIFKGIECDILHDGSLDYPDDVLHQFDFVIASVHQHLRMTEDEATKRIIRAIEHPEVNILGHPTGRLLMSRQGYELDWSKIFDACRINHVAIELNANPHRLDMDWRVGRKALEKDIFISVNPDAHNLKGCHDLDYGVFIARKSLYPKELVINTFSPDRLMAFFNKSRL
ncbi:MAG: DNA polymerase/3'-5' exonuclease PolX [Calditrichia bacterium]